MPPMSCWDLYSERRTNCVHVLPRGDLLANYRGFLVWGVPAMRHRDIFCSNNSSQRLYAMPHLLNINGWR